MKDNILFKLSSRFPKLDIVQRKMLRNIIGWIRVPDEDWEVRMRRMNRRMEYSQSLYCCESWSMSFASNQWRFIHHLKSSHLLLWVRKIIKYNFNEIDDPMNMYGPYRVAGCPQ